MKKYNSNKSSCQDNVLLSIRESDWFFVANSYVGSLCSSGESFVIKNFLQSNENKSCQNWHRNLNDNEMLFSLDDNAFSELFCEKYMKSSMDSRIL